jgi:hypothetical protein
MKVDIFEGLRSQASDRVSNVGKHAVGVFDMFFRTERDAARIKRDHDIDRSEQHVVVNSALLALISRRTASGNQESGSALDSPHLPAEILAQTQDDLSTLMKVVGPSGQDRPSVAFYEDVLSIKVREVSGAVELTKGAEGSLKTKVDTDLLVPLGIVASGAAQGLIKASHAA